MLLKTSYVICLLFINFLIQSSTCALPNNIQNLELDDITSLWDKFPAIIDKIKEAVNRFRCPKGWKRLGGSCYYLSNLTSSAIDANYTCNLMYSNLSNLMQVRHTVELFYAAHVLSRNNLSSLIIDVDPSLLQGRKISEMLTNDPDRWRRMKKQFDDIRKKYKELKEKVLNRLSSTGLKILRRTKKVKDFSSRKHAHQNDFQPSYYEEYDVDDREFNITDPNLEANSITVVHTVDDEDEYEYDDLDSPDESDPFEQIDDISSVCQRIDWNVLNQNSNSTVYVLTTYIVSDATVCSLSDVDTDMEYHHVCEYVLDFCFANILCGKYGRCVNTLAGFRCSCNFLYGGVLCDRISDHGKQIITGIIIIIILTALSLKLVRKLLWFFTSELIKLCRIICVKRSRINNPRSKETNRNNNGPSTEKQRRPTLAQELIEFFAPKRTNPLKTPVKRNLARNIWVGSLTISFVTVLFFSTSLMYLISFGYGMNSDHDEEFSINDTIRLVNRCVTISDYRTGNLIFAPFAISLILIFSWSLKRRKLCLHMCDGRPALITPIEPFRTGNRFTTATVFGILAFEVLKIFEELLFRTGQPLRQGVLIELLERIALIILVGLRYYPVLASLQLRNIVARGFACFYILCDMFYTIIREGSCMGFLPLSGRYTDAEEAKLRRELGTWFIVYGVIKNIPHFFLLSYISGELCVRFIYDSVYVPMRKKRTIWSAPVVELDDSEYSKYYVTKLFRRNHRSQRIVPAQNEKVKLENLVDYEHDAEVQNTINRSRVKKFFDHIYHSNNDFRFTTIATCTYTVAIVFLYYLACTFAFLYLSRTAGHISFLKFYIESTFNVELGAFSLKYEIIFSAILTAIIYGFQLYIGMQNYQKHKLQLYKGIYVDVPSAINFKPSSMASNSVHYSGFLVGYMAWGFVICFHVILFFLISVRIVSLQIRHIEFFLAIIVPVLVIYFLKMLSMRSAGKFIFIQQLDDKLNLKNRKTYAMFVYFSFFADCFLGVASCIIRLLKATFLNVVFMARLDWSFLGRPLERFDLGFAAYISYLHMEVTYTNPVMLAFCYSVYDDIIQRRPKQCYDDECCIAPGELDDDQGVQPPKEILVQKNLSIIEYRRKKQTNTPIEDETYSRVLIKETKQRSRCVRIAENKSEVDLPKQSLRPNKSDKSSNASIDEQQAHGDDSQSDCPPEVPPRRDLTSESDENDSSERRLLSVQKDNRTSKGKKKRSKSDTKTDKTIPFSAPLGTHHRRTKVESASQSSHYDQTEHARQQPKDTTLSSSYDEIVESTTNVSDTLVNIKRRQNAVECQFDERKKLVVCCPSSHNATTASKDSYPLRTISNRHAHQNQQPLLPSRPNRSSKIHRADNTDDNNENDHYVEIASATMQLTTQNYSSSEVRLKNDLISCLTDENDHEDTQDEVRLLHPKQFVFSGERSEDPERKEEMEKIRKRKRLRFRWHFLYTILRNYHLFDLRKDVQGRLTRLHIQRSSLIDENQLPMAATVRQFETETFVPQGDFVQVAESRAETTSLQDISAATIEQLPSPPRRLLSVAVPATIEYPQSPAERYIAIRAQMLYDTSTQQMNMSSSPKSSRTPTTAASLSGQRPAFASTMTSDRSQGFQITPDIAIQPPSDSGSKSVKTHLTSRSAYHTTQHSPYTPLTFLPGVPSTPSTADYPAATTSIANSSTLRTQMSHDQHMQAWRQGAMDKIQRKQRYCYMYGPPPQTPLADKVSCVAILTPQILTTATTQQEAPPFRQQETPSTTGGGKLQRPPTKSPFNFSVSSQQIRTASSSAESDIITSENDRQLKGKCEEQAIPIPPQRMERLDEDPLEISVTAKSSIITSALISRHKSDSDSSDMKNV
ncbi:unnamed protein product [Adineta ricciae]|uniref:EGF-like domain-containing protein n=1 Tax=Adineta ricciae TaxID=249248 RepID=A0A814BR25_ADIRI|nr:unnamed protein product [Adineta ricciae]